MKKICLFLCVIFSITIFAEVELVDSNNYYLSDYSEISAPFFYDFDQDGDKDIIFKKFEYTGSTQNQLWWKENLGNGNFAQHILLDNFSPYYHFTFVNYDNQDREELIVCKPSYFSDELQVLVYKIDANDLVLYDTFILPFLNLSIEDFWIGDIDNDLDFDIILNYKDEKIIYFENLGSEFSEMRSFKDAYDVNSMEVFDFDNDGFQELITIKDGINVYKNISGNFQKEQLMEDIPNQIKVYDFDYDNDMDLVYSHTNSTTGFEEIRWIENVGDNLANMSNFIMNVPNDSERKIKFDLADFGNDNDTDFVIISDHVSLKTYENISNQGDFFIRKITDTIRWFYTPNLYLEDINNDGFLDLFYHNRYLNLYSISYMDFYLGREDGFDNKKYSVQKHTKNVSATYFADLDGDNNKDILMLSKDKNRLVWLDDSNGLTSHKVLTLDLTNPDNLFIYDFDQDGDNDIFIDDDSKYITYLENYNGNFSDLKTLHSPSFVNYILGFFDLDNNGIKELIFISANNRLGIIEHDDNFTFSFLESFPEINTRLKFNDIDNDGFLDVFYLNNDLKLSYAKNLGDFSFSEVIQLSDSIIGQYNFIDFNNDDYEDLVISESNVDNSEIEIFKLEYNPEVHSFTTNISLGFIEKNVSQFIVEDIDNDSYSDLIINSYDGWWSDLIILENTENELYSHILYNNIEGRIKIRFYDYNNDGLLDFIKTTTNYYAQQYNNSLVFKTNTGNGFDNFDLAYYHNVSDRYNHYTNFWINNSAGQDQLIIARSEDLDALIYNFSFFEPLATNTNTAELFPEILSIYPNPFMLTNSSKNNKIIIDYRIEEDSVARIEVFNIKGQLVKTIKNSFHNKGKYSLEWNAENLNNKKVASGVYFIRMDSKNFHNTKKIILLK